MTTEPTFTPQQLLNFRAYVRVQTRGTYNMSATGLSRDDYLFVMKNYEALEKAAHRQMRSSLNGN